MMCPTADTFAPDRAARASDPDTSHAAADLAVGLAQEHQQRIFGALREYGPMGKDGIARVTGLDGVAVARRLPELQRQGIAEPTGDKVESATGRLERVWRAI